MTEASFTVWDDEEKKAIFRHLERCSLLKKTQEDSSGGEDF